MSENGVAVTAKHCLVPTQDVRKKGGKPTLKSVKGAHSPRLCVALLASPTVIFPLEVRVPQVEDLDLAIVGVPGDSSSRGTWSHLRLPDKQLDSNVLYRTMVSMYHADIALRSAYGSLPALGVNIGHVVSADQNFMHLSFGAHGGHSGAAVVMAGGSVIGVHVEGFNDLPDKFSATSPSTDAVAQRLDIESVRRAVLKEIERS